MEGAMPTPHHSFQEALSAWKQPKPANDNQPLRVDSFPNLAARRAYVQCQQRNPEPVLNLPQLERLGRTSPESVRLWKYWRDLQAAPAADVYNEPEIVVDEGDEPANTDFSEGGEQDLEIRPTVDEMMRAMEGAGRVAVICTVRNGVRSDVRRMERPLEFGETTRIGDLIFRNGKMVRFGRTARGVPLKPVERLRASKGSREKPPPRDFRFLVRTDAPFARCVDFHAGTVHSTGRSGAPLECFAEREQSRKAEEQSLRQTLGAHAEILDMAVGDATAREIGESRGYQGKHAERRGIFLINEALAALGALVGQNISSKAA
jgi:hypothetical protein